MRGDGKYNNRAPDRDLAQARVDSKVTVAERPAGVAGPVPLPYRRVIVERTNAWAGKYRRDSVDSERTPESAGAMVQVPPTHLMLRRLKPDASAPRADSLYARKPMKKAAQLSG